jgi:hypothetical protein
MDHQRLAELLREADMPVELILLYAERRVLPIQIEPGFAKRNNPRLTGQSYHFIPVARLGLSRVVGVDARRRPDPSMVLSKRQAIPTAGGRSSNRQDRRNSDLGRPRDHGGRIRRKLLVVEMRVRIEQFHDWDPLMAP